MTKIYQYSRLACAYFFFGNGLAYGIFTSRMPAYKSFTGATDGEIGLLLLCFGIFSLLTLMSSAWLINRFGLNRILGAGFAILCIAWMGVGVAPSPILLAIPMAVAGVGTGLCDVAMNALGIATEQHFKVHCMSFLHASFSLGGVVGAVSGSLFVWLNVGPALNALIILGLWLIWLPWSYRHSLRDDKMTAVSKQKSGWVWPPFFVYFCGFLTMLAYMAEGSVGEWGSLFLHSDKGASEEVAALVFGAFSTTMVMGRLLGDSLRDHFGDFIMLGVGATLGFVGMGIALFAAWPLLSLAGYSLMGVGMAPIVPILFSRAGSRPGVNVAQATSVVSTMAYSGMLFFPPLLGFLGNHYGLGKALLIPLAGCAVIAAGSLVVRRN